MNYKVMLRNKNIPNNLQLNKQFSCNFHQPRVSVAYVCHEGSLLISQRTFVTHISYRQDKQPSGKSKEYFNV